ASYDAHGRRIGFYPAAMLMYAGLAMLIRATDSFDFFAAFFKVDGSKPMSGDIDAGGHVVKNAVRESLAQLLWERIRRRPMIIPVVMEV
ncbi:MAG: hypothetical protein HGB10_11635, partial [Coriobacteriia bacterium]|nr:hypothetical protein [Coriobacteriia bacterium]